MIALVDNPVELVGLIELMGGLPEGVCGPWAAPVGFGYTEPIY